MEIRPFRAFRFDEKVVGDAGGCIAPPYDVIDRRQQEQLYKKNKYNIVRITKGKQKPADNESNNQYTRAADYFNDWIKKGVLKQDSADAFYAHIQDFEIGGGKFQRLSFIALMKLEEFGKMVRPHEETLDEPKLDRLKLLRATAANFGLVFMLYEDKKKIADRIIRNAAKQKSLVDFLDEQKTRHRLFAITAQKDIEAIVKTMRNKSCIIADGHHRYETGLNYFRETGNPAAAYQMSAFVNVLDKGLIVLATHRLIGGLEYSRAERLLAELERNFKVTEFRFDLPSIKDKAGKKMLAQMKAENKKGKNIFGIYCGNNAFYTALLKNKRAMDSAACDMSRGWRSLDVPVLHKLVLEKPLRLNEKKLVNGLNIEYTEDTEGAVEEAIAKVDGGQKQIAFFVNPVKIRQLKKITSAGEKIPQKSTYFYPKMYTGLTINKM